LGKRDNRAGEAAAIKRPEAASACGPTKGRRRGRAADAVGPRPGARVRPRGRDDAWDPPVGDTRGKAVERAGWANWATESWAARKRLTSWATVLTWAEASG
jgi:hypothetical protein